MPYVDKILAPDEEVTYVGKISVWTLVPRSLLGAGVLFVLIWAAWALRAQLGSSAPGIAAIVGAFSWLALVSRALLDYLFTEIVITNQRIVSKHGWLNIATTSTDLDKVNNINVRQPLLGRILGYGNVEITTATAEERDNHFINKLADPQSFDIALRTELEIDESRS